MTTSLVHRVRCILGKEKARVLRKLNFLKRDWKTALPEETRFWAHALSDPEKWDLKEYQDRTNPDLPLQDDLKKLLAQTKSDLIKILDVGAGPLTRVGKKWDDRIIEITATDPLAAEYDIILKGCGISPIVRTVNAEGESLSHFYPLETFDLAYASNCLDHSRDPIEVIRQMLLLIKPGGAIYLWHFVNVGLTERYRGLHQWNFSRLEGDLKISDGKHEYSLREHIDPKYTISCWDEHMSSNKVVITSVQKP